MKSLFFTLVFGTLLSLCSSAQSEVKLPSDSLPVTIQKNISEKFKTCKVTEVKRGRDASGNMVYKVDAQDTKKNSITTWHLVYDGTGKLTEKKKEKEVLYTDGPDDPKKEKHSGGGSPFPRY